MTEQVCGLFLIAVVGATLVSAALAGPEEVDLAGTRPGPTGYYMPLKERAAYIQKMKTDPAARKDFQEKVLKRADEAAAALAEDEQAKGDIVACARAWLVTKEQKYLEAVRKLAAREVKLHFEQYGPSARAKKKIIINGNNEITWGRHTPVAKAYDLVADKLPPDEEKAIRAYIKDRADRVMEWHLYVANGWEDIRRGKYFGTTSNKNINARTLGIWSEVGYAIGYKKFIDWITDMPPTKGACRTCPGGFKQWIANSIPDNALWGESPVYGRYFLDGVIPMARYAANYDGSNLFAVKSEDGSNIQGMIDGIIDIAWPASTGTYVADSHATQAGGQRLVITHADYGESPNYGYDILGPGWGNAVRMMYERTGDPKYGWFVSVMDGKPGDNPPPAPCRVFPNAGIVMLRADTSPSYWMGEGLAIMCRGLEQVRTSPADTLSFILHANGKLWYPQWSPWTYENARTVGWNRRHLRFNTVAIDGRIGYYSHTMYRSDFSPEVKLLSMRGSRHGRDTQERIFMLTNEYALELFDLAVGKEVSPLMAFGRIPYGYYSFWSGAPVRENTDRHTFDYVLHGLGLQSVDRPELFEPSEEFTRAGYAHRWLERERTRRTSDSFYVDWREGDEGIRMRMLGEPGRTAYLADSPRSQSAVTDRDEKPLERIPLVAVRHVGNDALFAALHEPYRKAPQITAFHYLHRPSREEGQRTVAVRVKSPRYTDRLYATLGLQGNMILPKPRLEEKLLADREVVTDITKDWLFKPDPQDVGEKEKWYAKRYDRSDWLKVDAGRDWKKDVPNYYGTGWYAKKFWAPKVKKLYVLFEGVDEDAWVYLNGKLVGTRIDPGGYKNWNKPFVTDVSKALRPGDENLLVVRVWKNLFCTGIYKPVKLLVENPGANPVREVEDVKEGEHPLVTVAADDDPNEKVTFRGQAYFRREGNRLVARGDIAGFCIAAPGLPKKGAVTLNGKPAAYELVGDYVVVGEAAKPGATAKAPKQPDVTDHAGSPVELEFPQQFINVDAEKGGHMVVRVTNHVAPVVSGRIEVACGPGLKTPSEAQTFEGLKKDHRSERVFDLQPDGAKAGTLVPVRVRLFLQGKPVWETWRQVAVGVVAEEVDYSYYQELFMYPGRKLPGRLDSKEEYPFDVVRVRAPGYTIDVDKFSGCSRYIVKPDGTLGWKAGTYPMRRLRYEKRLARPWRFGPGVWQNQATFDGLGWDAATGDPTVGFRSADGSKSWTYRFAPDAAYLTVSGKPGGKAGYGLPKAPKPVDNEPIIPPEPAREKKK